MEKLQKFSRRKFLEYLTKATLGGSFLALILKFKGDQLGFKKILKEYLQEIKQKSTESWDLKKENELKQIQKLLANRDWIKVLENKFLMASFYWSEGFWQKLEKDLRMNNSKKNVGNQNEPIIQKSFYWEIKKLLSPQIKNEFYKFLITYASQKFSFEKTSSETKLSLPLKKFIIPEGKNHPDALDIFTDEGEPIFSITNGLVVLADKNWKENDYFSSHSMLGGNAVIIFDPQGKRFFRYAHLDKVEVNVGQIVLAGEVIGTVGHTGINAQKPGHGNHLHLEINKIVQDKNNNFKVISLKSEQIKKLINKIKISKNENSN